MKNSAKEARKEIIAHCQRLHQFLGVRRHMQLLKSSASKIYWYHGSNVQSLQGLIKRREFT